MLLQQHAAVSTHGSYFGCLLGFSSSHQHKLMVIYTPQNKLRVTQCFSPYVDYWLCSVAQTRQDVEKRFSASLKESKMKRFQSKIWHLKFSFSSFAKFAIFAKFQKIMFYPFY